MLGRPELREIERNIQREVDRAWLQHEPERRRVDPKYYRQLNALKRSWEPTAEAARKAIANSRLLQRLITDCYRRKGMARKAALKAVERAFPGAQINVGDIFEMVWLAPSGPVVVDPRDYSERQTCTLVVFLAAWEEFYGFSLRSGWSLLREDHAGARYLERAGPNGDLKRALFQAANHFMAADIELVSLHVGRNSDVYLPTNEGFFVCNVVGARSSGGHKFLYARASTFVEKVKLFPNQIPLRKAASAKNSVAALLLE